MADDVASAYDVWAESYDTMANATRDLDARMLRELLNARGRDVVEVGCGTGKNTVWLAEQARSVVALDFSAGMLAKARERVTAANVRFVQQDLRTTWPLADASADVVTFDLVLEHVERLAPVLGEAARVLRPGGVVYVCELHPFRQLKGGQAQFVGEGGESVRVAAWHHDVADYVNAAVAAGLRIERLHEVRDEAGGVPRLLVMTARR
jgi:ubiquinone/menaquinone biosynthesis C-methylase UbiE